MKISFSLMLVLCFSGPVEPTESADRRGLEKEQVERWAQYYSAQAGRYEFLVEGDPQKPLLLVEGSVLRWSNPVTGNGTTHGDCFIWTHHGRPVVFSSIFSYIDSRNQTADQRVLAHAFNCLSQKPLVGRRQGRVFWHPEKADGELQEIPNAPAVASSANGRLVQMRNLARQFTAVSDYGDDEHRLRLMPQPLYRYDSVDQGVVDGALFAFVMGTDPEIMLLIEARDTPDGPRWYFSAARHSHLTLRMHHQGTEVWNYVRGSHPIRRDTTHHYISVHRIEVRDAIITDEEADRLDSGR
jgi:hypothetical protein